MARWDSVGLFWEDAQTSTRGGPRQLGPMPEIPDTGWKTPTEFPSIRDAPWISFDTETYDPELIDNGPGWARGKGHICGISVATEGGAWYFPMRHTVEPEYNLDPDTVLRWARWALGGNGVKIGANALYDLGWLKHEGVEVNGPIYDPQYAEALLNETSRVNLDTLGWKYLREGKTSDLLKDWAMSYYGGSERYWRSNIYRCPPRLVGAYAEQDAILPKRVLVEQWKELSRLGLLDLFYMECKLIRILMKMRFAGVQVDIPYVEKLYDDFGIQLAQKAKQISDTVGFHCNYNSSEDMARAFDLLGIKYGRTAAGNPSFTKNYLEAQPHPFARMIVDARGFEKLRNTFLKGYLLDGHVNGKVYCSFHPTNSEDGGTRTGRFSSSSPNLQNIPTRSAEGKLIRKAFTFDPGHKQVRDYDYSQIEYRFLAHFAIGAGSDEVRRRYHEDPNLDYHKLIGSMITDTTGIVLERGHIKNINFGLVYGLGIATLAYYLKTSIEEAKRLSESFHKSVPFASATMNGLMEEVNRTGVVTTILGRINHFDLWEPSDWNRRKGMVPLPYQAALSEWGTDIMRAYLYRAINYRLQGSAAEIMKKGLVLADDAGIFDATGVPRLTVHDELYFSEPHGVADEAWSELKHTFETAIPLSVPIRFDCDTGPTWAEAH